MKKTIIALVLILLMSSGCSSKKADLNISKWMFDDSLDYSKVEKRLGESDLSTDKVIEYSNWNINNTVSGALSFKEIEDSDIAIHWKFTANTDDEQYKQLHTALKDAYDELEKYHETQTKDGVSCIFLTTYDAPNYNDYVYSIRLVYMDGRVTIEWGSITSPKP